MRRAGGSSGSGGGDGRELGGAVDPLGDAAEAVRGLGDQRRVDVGAAAGEEPEARDVGARQVGMVREVAQEGRRAHHVGDPLAARSAGRASPGSQRGMSTALDPRAAGTRTACTSPEMCVRGEGMRTVSPGPRPCTAAEAAGLGEERLVRVQHALRVGGGARGVHHQRDVVGRDRRRGGRGAGERRRMRACPARASSRTTITSRERRADRRAGRRADRGGRSRDAARDEDRARAAVWRRMKATSRARWIGRIGTATAPRRAGASSATTVSHQFGQLHRDGVARATTPSAASPPATASARAATSRNARRVSPSTSAGRSRLARGRGGERIPDGVAGRHSPSRR